MNIFPNVNTSAASQEANAALLQEVAGRIVEIRQNLEHTEALLRQLAIALEWPPTSLISSTSLTDMSSSVATTQRPVQTDSTRHNTLHIYCLGPFRVYRNGQAVSSRAMGKGQDVLKFLIMQERQFVLRDVLLEAIWPDADPHIANNRLKVAIHHLRQSLRTALTTSANDDPIVFEDDCYGFNPSLTLWTDVSMFENCCRAGLRLERLSQLAQAVPFYVQAVELYGGDCLAEDRFKDWTLTRREALKDSYLTVLDKLSGYWLEIGEYDRALQGWKKIVEKDPWREDAYRRLMACCALQGNRGLALRWYNVCETTLAQQLAIEPEPTTLALYESIRSGESVTV